MSRRKKPAANVSKHPPNTLAIVAAPQETTEQAKAHASLRPTVQAALTLTGINKSFGDLDINTLVGDLVAQCAQAHSGDLQRAESMLVTQAHTLDALFQNLARRAAINMGEYMDAAETYFRLALKAQAQCRATLETLAAIKNPQPVAFVRQANIAHGPQQVNNGAASSRAGNSESPQNELSRLTHEEGQRLAPGTAAGAGAAHPAMAPLGAIHRPQDDGR